MRKDHHTPPPPFFYLQRSLSSHLCLPLARIVAPPHHGAGPATANPDALLPLPTTQWWGWSAATAADAVPAVAADKSAAHILARCPGGCPAVHDAVEQLGEVLAGLTTNHD